MKTSHSFLCGHIPLESYTQVYGESVTLCHTRQYRTSFSHADLCTRNIIVRDGEIAAIVEMVSGVLGIYQGAFWTS